MAEFELPDEMRDEARTAWHRYLDLLNPFRPDLHRYCLRLTRDLWDAEDLVQDTLLRGFGTLGVVHQRIDNPRAYLLRIATNAWVDKLRRRELESAALSADDNIASYQPAAPPSPADSMELRDAGAALMEKLSPQERAAVVLKDVFDMTLDETARVLATTVGAVKAALHRGRGRLREPGRVERRRAAPTRALVDRFIERLEARDLPGLLELMLDTGTIEAGYLLEVGRTQFEREGGWLWSAVHGHPKRPRRYQAWDLTHERIEFQGEPLCLAFSHHDGHKALTTALRFDEQDERIERIRVYRSPDLVRALGEALDLPVRTFGLYRVPTPAPGKSWD